MLQQFIFILCVIVSVAFASFGLLLVEHVIIPLFLVQLCAFFVDLSGGAVEVVRVLKLLFYSLPTAMDRTVQVGEAVRCHS